jgi:hypothetical protein
MRKVMRNGSSPACAIVTGRPVKYIREEHQKENPTSVPNFNPSTVFKIS